MKESHRVSVGLFFYVLQRDGKMRQTCKTEGCIHEVSYADEHMCRECFENKQRMEFCNFFSKKEFSGKESDILGKPSKYARRKRFRNE